MRLRSFQAETMTEAMALVRDTLGDEAIIISTREDKKDNLVRVTAAVEEYEAEEDYNSFENFAEDAWLFGETGDDEGDESFDDFDLIRPERSITKDHHDVINEEEEEFLETLFTIRDDKPNEDIDFFDWEITESEDGDVLEQGFIEPITESLLRHNVPAPIADKIISSAIASSFEQTVPALMAAFDDVYDFAPLPKGRAGKPIILIGPPGGGKTLAAAKIAARASMNDDSVAVITTDTIRAGAVEQLEAFTRLLDVKLLTADDPIALDEAIRMCGDVDQIIIDTPGISPFDPDDMKMIASFLKIAQFDTYLVMPAGGDPSESADIARAFEILGVKKLMPSRLDISRRYGGILTAAYMANLALSDAGNSPKVAKGLMRITPESLTEVLIPHLFDEPVDD